MNDYSTTVTNKQLYVTYIMAVKLGCLLIGFRMVVMDESPEEVADILLANTIQTSKLIIRFHSNKEMSIKQLDKVKPNG